MHDNIKDFCPSNTSGPRNGPQSKRVQEAIYSTRNNNNNNNNNILAKIIIIIIIIIINKLLTIRVT